MNNQLNILDIIDVKQEESNDVLERRKWQEFHANGQLWIDGEIIIVKDKCRFDYKFLNKFEGYEGKNVVRVGVWTKYSYNGQLAWKLDYGDGLQKSTKQKQKLCP